MSESNYILPTEPAGPWLGGKSRLADTIIDWINSVDHALYAEPFIGMGGVFLRRNKRPKAEVINDYNGEVCNFFRVVQNHSEAFQAWIRYMVTSRKVFDLYTQVDPNFLTDIQRAARFIYILKSGFGGRITSRSFGVDTTGSGRFDAGSISTSIDNLHRRLSGVTIECLNYSDFIDRYDRPHTLFYLDPPYWGCEDDYGKNLFCRADFERLATQLASIKGRFILSLNDVPEVRDIFKAFKIEGVKTTYTIAKGDKAQEAAEVLIHNLPETPRRRQENLI